MHWIEPLKEQLNRLERRFEQLSSLGATKCGTSMASTSKSSRPIPLSPVESISHDEQGDDASEKEGTDDTG